VNSLNDTVILEQSGIWTVDIEETAETFEARIVATISGRRDGLRLAVDALTD
jgi:hypothetical protein